jgi:hypothetical protein
MVLQPMRPTSTYLPPRQRHISKVTVLYRSLKYNLAKMYPDYVIVSVADVRLAEGRVRRQDWRRGLKWEDIFLQREREENVSSRTSEHLQESHCVGPWLQGYRLPLNALKLDGGGNIMNRPKFMSDRYFRNYRCWTFVFCYQGLFGCFVSHEVQQEGFIFCN